jgi:hypothetical protein
MSQISFNVAAPLGYTGPALVGNNDYFQIVDTSGNSIFKVIPSSESTSIGRLTLTNTTAQANTAFGHRALEDSTTGGLNTAVGAYALALNTTGTENTALGVAAGGGITNGTKSVFIGRTAGGFTQAGNENTVVGYEAGYGQNPFGASTGMGNGNTCVGAKSGHQLTGGTFNTYIGWEAGYGETTGTNNICLGRSSQSASLTTSNSITLGNQFNTVLRCAVQVITGLSDARDKKDVAPIDLGLEFVKELNPVKFVWDDRNENGKHDVVDSGFIAQDLKALEDKYEAADVLKLVYDENPEKLEASYGRLIPVLVQAIKDLAAKVETLENK